MYPCKEGNTVSLDVMESSSLTELRAHGHYTELQWLRKQFQLTWMCSAGIQAALGALLAKPQCFTTSEQFEEEKEKKKKPIK